jgi:signal transduction histidine kinase
MRERRGIKTRMLLVAATALIVAGATFCSLLIVRHRMQAQVTDNLTSDLAHSVATFQNLQMQRLSSLDRENALLADLPSLKALMTTSDRRTIEDAGVEFWRVSGNDLFALADNQGHMVTAYTKNHTGSNANLLAGLHTLLGSSATHYLVDGDHLYACSVRPLYFGRQTDGTLLGYVISGFAIDREILAEISQATAAEATFISEGRAVASTLDAPVVNELTARATQVSHGTSKPVWVELGKERYITEGEDLSSHSSAPLQLIVLKSFDQAQQSIRQIDRLVIIAGVFALILGIGLMAALSKFLTRPLEDLATGVRAFGVGDSSHLLPENGTREVRELSMAFASMRSEILHANQALLESERLATIGRMASSVSHDLRHYLASVYANAEFLASSPLSEAERSDILSDIRTAVHGTTELIESMLIFSRTGAAIRRGHELVATLLERAMTLLRAHPDAAGVTLVANSCDPLTTAAVVDGRQMERAIYNLLLNACQSAHAYTGASSVLATLEVSEGLITLQVEDNGAGVPEGIRSSLFQPFVSEGKQKGTGLGLTLAHCIAAEHGGEVTLVSTRPGETIFRMTIASGLVPQTAPEGTNQRRYASG